MPSNKIIRHTAFVVVLTVVITVSSVWSLVAGVQGAPVELLIVFV